jgi:transcriptional regulator with XRE-family HTH domain
MEQLAQVVGEVLRDVREERGLTLRKVSEQSQGRFKPSVIGGYERGERSISLVRFCELASFYGIPADRLLARALKRLDPAAHREAVLDLGRLDLFRNEVGEAVNGFVRRVKRERGDTAEEIITLRSGDLEAVALESGVALDRLLAALRPVLRGDGR